MKGFTRYARSLAAAYICAFMLISEFVGASGAAADIRNGVSASKGSCSAFRVVELTQGLQRDNLPVRQERSVPTSALGSVDEGGGNTFVSLGYGGSITLEFEFSILNGSGQDLTIYESSGIMFQERADVYASQDGQRFVKIGTATNGINGSQSSNPRIETHIDLQGLKFAKFIRLVDTTDRSLVQDNQHLDGFDLNAVTGIDCGTLPECQDGLDNDGDGATDYSQDSECESEEDDREFPGPFACNATDPRVQCFQREIGTAKSASFGVNPDYSFVVVFREPATSAAIIAAAQRCELEVLRPGNFSSAGVESALSPILELGALDPGYSAYVDGKCSAAKVQEYRNAGVTISADVDCNQPQLAYNFVRRGGVFAAGVGDKDEAFFATAVCRPKLTGCNDRIDNDGDGRVDFPADPGCSGPGDGDERDPNGPQCDNGTDDDQDGKIDFPGDSDCTGPGDDTERPVPTATPTVAATNTAVGTPTIPLPTPAATHTATPVPTTTAAATPAASSPVVPIFDCVMQNADGSSTAWFGYDNREGVPVQIAIGDQGANKNFFSPGTGARGQPSQFLAGRVKGAFGVVFNERSIRWTVQRGGGSIYSAEADTQSVKCAALTPTLQCISIGPNNSLIALFGYQNDNDFEITLPVGPFNSFEPDPADRGQPTKFEKGNVTSAFSVPFEANAGISWLLGSTRIVANLNSPLCSTSNGCTLLPVVEIKTALDETALALASLATRAAERLDKAARASMKGRSLARALTDAQRASARAKAFEQSARELVLTFPDVVQSCPDGTEQCVQTDNQAVLEKLEQLYAKQFRGIRRFIVRALFREGKRARANKNLITEARRISQEGKTKLQQMPRYATLCR